LTRNATTRVTVTRSSSSWISNGRKAAVAPTRRDRSGSIIGFASLTTLGYRGVFAACAVPTGLTLIVVALLGRSAGPSGPYGATDGAGAGAGVSPQSSAYGEAMP
jgi:hypothetical protein